MKKPKAVVEAEAALSNKRAEILAAEETVKRLRLEFGECFAAVTKAQTEADANLPQCTMVSIAWRSGKEDGGAPYVILRRTPGGKLVVRRVGDASGSESKFEWQERGVFVDCWKTSYASAHFELRNVPREFIPEVNLGAVK